NQNNKKSFKGHHGENSHHSLTNTGVSTHLKDGSETWKTVWDTKTGYIATKVFSKNTCIIAKMDKRFLLDKRFPAPPQRHKKPRPHRLPPREYRFMISRSGLHSLHPYGRRIQALCRGIPSYLAYPAAGEYTGLYTKIK
ncbi:GKN1 protein, partial [Rhynochetos jubatus]|nr:GKN1 protein [Rhynochetos jubatus]